MANAKENVQSPIGTFEWVFIDGNGKEDLQGNSKFVANVVVDPDQVDETTTDAQAANAKAFIASVEDFWEANKPAAAKGKFANAKSNGIYKHSVDSGEKDEHGDKIYTETGKYSLSFKTGTTFTDGKAKVIGVANAKGAPISLQGKKIGNGSRGRIKGAMGIYNFSPSMGVALYLNSVQLTKFVEFSDGFDAVEDEDEEAFEGVGEFGGVVEEPQEAATTNESPRLD